MTESQKQDIRIMNKVADRLRMYGVEIKRGRCRGFCHNGHDYNMVVKDDCCFCYVCRKTFDIFDIVMFFENCGFKEAVEKLDKPIDFNTFRKIKKIKQVMKTKQTENEIKEKRYWELWNKWFLIDTIIKNVSPYSQLYADALHRREYLNYIMEVEL